jgi:hypothetical protein
MTLKKKLFYNFFINLPIAGGDGTSFEEAIIIESDPNVNIYSLETEIIELLMNLQNATFKKVKQQYIADDMVYDVITILKKENGSDIEIKEEFYFDITAYRRN